MLGFPIISVVIGAVIALVFPGLFDGHFKGKRKKKSFATLCRIIGLAIIAYAVVSWGIDLVTSKV